MKPIIVYHGSDQSDIIPDGRPLYATPDPRYRYTQARAHVYQAKLSPKSPYITDKVSFVESLRSDPERIRQLKLLGYDTVVYASPKNPTKGASGLGDDSAQYVILSPSVLTQWQAVNKRELSAPTEEAIASDALKGPVYHSTTSFFHGFDFNNEIGAHFGSRRAASERLSTTHQSPDVEVQELSPSPLDNLRARYASGGGEKSPAGMVYGELLKRLRHLKPGVLAKLKSMNEDELLSVMDDYRSKPVLDDHHASLARVKQGVHYNVCCEGEVLFESPSKQDAQWFKEAVQAHFTKKAYIVMENPLHLDDLGSWTPHDILNSLGEQADCWPLLAKASTNAEKFNIVRQAVVEAGYDGISYTNEVEDKGSLSYLAISNDQIIPISPQLPRMKSAPENTLDSPSETMGRRR
jgi:hypothetical protein